MVKSISAASINVLADEKELLEDVVTFFTEIVHHYGIGVEAHNGESDELRMLAGATLMKALGRLIWKLGDQIAAHMKSKVAASVWRCEDEYRCERYGKISFN